MIKVELNKPVLLDRQIKGISGMLGIPERDLMGIVTNEQVVITEDAAGYREGEIVPTRGLWEKIKAGTLGAPFAYGSEGIIVLCALGRVCARPLTEIYIPVDVYKKSQFFQWDGISTLVSKAIDSNERIARLMSMGAPTLAIMNEYKLLRERVEYLEHNDQAVQYCYEDGMQVGSLMDVGYSMIDGWGRRPAAAGGRQGAALAGAR